MVAGRDFIHSSQWFPSFWWFNPTRIKGASSTWQISHTFLYVHRLWKPAQKVLGTQSCSKGFARGTYSTNVERFHTQHFFVKSRKKWLSNFWMNKIIFICRRQNERTASLLLVYNCKSFVKAFFSHVFRSNEAKGCWCKNRPKIFRAAKDKIDNVAAAGTLIRATFNVLIMKLHLITSVKWYRDGNFPDFLVTVLPTYLLKISTKNKCTHF